MTAQHSTAQHSTAQHSTVTAQHSTAQHSTVTAQHNTTQHNTPTDLSTRCATEKPRKCPQNSGSFRNCAVRRQLKPTASVQNETELQTQNNETTAYRAATLPQIVSAIASKYSCSCPGQEQHRQQNDSDFPRHFSLYLFERSTKSLFVYKVQVLVNIRKHKTFTL